MTRSESRAELQLIHFREAEPNLAPSTARSLFKSLSGTQSARDARSLTFTLNKFPFKFNSFSLQILFQRAAWETFVLQFMF